jgi:hypothetical protein
VNKDESRDQPHRQLAAIIPGRLIAPHTADRHPSPIQVGESERLMDESSAWQAVGSTARDMAGLAASTRGTQFNRMYELGGLIASIGERLALVHAARVEGELWREVIEAAAAPQKLDDRARLTGYQMA